MKRDPGPPLTYALDVTPRSPLALLLAVVLAAPVPALAAAAPPAPAASAHPAPPARAAPAAAVAASPAAKTRLALVYDAPVDLPLTVGASALWLGLELGAGRQPLSTAPPVNPPGGIDALAVLHLDPGLARAADVLLTTTLVLGLGAEATLGFLRHRPWTHALLYLETLAVIGTVTNIAKWAVRRPRPYTYDKRLGVPDDDLSFFSGHSSFTGAVTFLVARTLDLELDLGTAGRIAAYGGATALTAVIALLRVLSGKHFPSDVIVGALVGGSVGFLVPDLHAKTQVIPVVVPTQGGGVAVSIAGAF